MKLLDILKEIGDSTQTCNLTGGELKTKESQQKEKLYSSYLNRAFPNSTISRNQSSGDITVQLNN